MVRLLLLIWIEAVLCTFGSTLCTAQAKPKQRVMIILASPSPQTLYGWRQALESFGPIVTTTQANAVRASILRDHAETLLLDFALPALNTPRAIAQLHSLSPATNIVVLSDPLSEDDELRLFKAGIRGYCRNDIDPQVLKRLVVAVRLGELWIRRALVGRLLEELGTRFAGDSPDQRAAIGRLAFLTEREREIAALVGNGGSNKHIARQLDISERTVKAHLTEIFRKLGIADRVKLALLLANSAFAGRAA